MKVKSLVIESLKRIAGKSAQISNVAQAMGENDDLTAEGLELIRKNIVEISKLQELLSMFISALHD